MKKKMFNIFFSLSRYGHLKSWAELIIERSEIRKKQHDFKSVHFDCRMVLFCRNSIFQVEFSGNIGRNSFRPNFQKSRLEYYFLCLFYFWSPLSGHLWSNFVVLLLLLTARRRTTRKVDHKYPEKQVKKSKRYMKNALKCLRPKDFM